MAPFFGECAADCCVPRHPPRALVEHENRSADMVGNCEQKQRGNVSRELFRRVVIAVDDDVAAQSPMRRDAVMH